MGLTVLLHGWTHYLGEYTLYLQGPLILLLMLPNHFMGILHGLPDEIVSDRDPKFTSKFWQELMDLCGVKLKISSSRYPQTNGLRR
jgi:hypothetical protein